MNHVVITGGAGFIGCNVARHLVRAGHQVTAIDDLSLGQSSNLEPGVRLVVGDAADAHVWDGLDAIDGIVHLAGSSSTPMFSADLASAFQNNVVGFLHVLEQARQRGVARVIYSSSALVYGNGPVPLREDAGVDVLNFYALSKLCMEQIARLYHVHYGFSLTGLRFMSIYGPREDHKRTMANLVSQFIWDIEAGRPPVVYGDGTQTRDFTNVWDVAEAIRSLLVHPAAHAGEVFNVGTGVPTSLNALIELLSEIIGVSVTPEFVQAPPRYNMHQVAAPERLDTAVGCRPSISLREGIGEILRHRRGDLAPAT